MEGTTLERQRVERDTPGNDEPEPVPPRRNRIGVALVVLGLVFALGAIPVAVVGFNAKSEAADARDEGLRRRGSRRGPRKRGG